jgi:hypothetical protein
MNWTQTIRLLFCVWTLLTGATPHPLHISSAQLTFTGKQEWTLKKTIFTDDLEEALMHAGYEAVRLSNPIAHQEKVYSYVRQSLRIQTTKGKDIPYTLEPGYIYDPESISLTLTFSTKKPFRLTDLMLTEVFSDQRNVYAVRTSPEGYSQHALLHQEEPTFTIE